MQQSELETVLAGLLEKAAGARPAQLGRGTPLEQLGLDSLGKIDLAVAVEDRFGVPIHDEDLERFVTIGDIMDHLQRATA